MAHAFETGSAETISNITEKALAAALQFGIFCAAIFFTFGNDWGIAFYQNEEAGVLLRLLAPIVPLLYLDVVVDSLLKGLDEQLNSMKYNFLDSFLRVLLILLFMRFSGMPVYIAILFFSSIFNAMLSVRRLLKVSEVRIQLFRHVLLPIMEAFLAVGLTRAVMALLPLSGLPLVLTQAAVCTAFYLSLTILFSMHPRTTNAQTIEI